MRFRRDEAIPPAFRVDIKDLSFIHVDPAGIPELGYTADSLKKTSLDALVCPCIRRENGNRSISDVDEVNAIFRSLRKAKSGTGFSLGVGLEGIDGLYNYFIMRGENHFNGPRKSNKSVLISLEPLKPGYHSPLFAEFSFRPTLSEEQLTKRRVYSRKLNEVLHRLTKDYSYTIDLKHWNGESTECAMDYLKKMILENGERVHISGIRNNLVYTWLRKLDSPYAETQLNIQRTQIA